MIQLPICKTICFYMLKLYIFEKCSLRAFKWYVTQCRKWAVSKNINCRQTSRNNFNWQYLNNYKCYSNKNIFYWIYSQRWSNWYVVKYTFECKFLLILILKWVQVVFTKRQYIESLAIWKTSDVFILKVYIFEKYFLRAFKWYIAQCQKSAGSKDINCRQTSRNNFNWQNLDNYKCYRFKKIFFLIYIQRRSNWYMLLKTLFNFNFRQF